MASGVAMGQAAARYTLDRSSHFTSGVCVCRRGVAAVNRACNRRRFVNGRAVQMNHELCAACDANHVLSAAQAGSSECLPCPRGSLRAKWEPSWRCRLTVDCARHPALCGDESYALNETAPLPAGTPQPPYTDSVMAPAGTVYGLHRPLRPEAGATLALQVRTLPDARGLPLRHAFRCCTNDTAPAATRADEYCDALGAAKCLAALSAETGVFGDDGHAAFCRMHGWRPAGNATGFALSRDANGLLAMSHAPDLAGQQNWAETG